MGLGRSEEGAAAAAAVVEDAADAEEAGAAPREGAAVDGEVVAEAVVEAEGEDRRRSCDTFREEL